MFEFQTISRPRYLKFKAPFETCLFSEPPSLKRVERRINGNLEQQAAAFFHHQFIANADPSWKEGAISDIGTVIGGSTPSKSKPEYYIDNGIAWITPKDLSVDKSKFISHGAKDITELGLRNSSASSMPPGTVLFSSRAPIGYIAIADSASNVIMLQSLALNSFSLDHTSPNEHHHSVPQTWEQALQVCHDMLFVS